MNRPIVSVILPIYNQEHYLEKSISSVLNQTYSGLDIVCVNDGSTDSSLSILQCYAEKDHRIKVVNKSNGGVVDALVVGIQNADGKYLCFVDPDDYIGPTYIDQFVQRVGDCDFVACGHYLDDGICIVEKHLTQDRKFNEDELKKLASCFEWDMKTRCLSTQLISARWNKMYKRDCVMRILPEYQSCKGVTLGEDTIFTYLLLKYAHSGQTVKQANSYFYNICNPNSVTANRNYEKYMIRLSKGFDKFCDMLSNHGDIHDNALVMYYFLVEPLFRNQRLEDVSLSFYEFYRSIRNNPTYIRGLNFLIKNSTGKKKMVFMARRLIKNPKIFLFCVRCKRKLSALRRST